MKRKRKSRKSIAPTNYSVLKRQVPDLFHASDRDQYDYFGDQAENDYENLQHLISRLEQRGLTHALANGTLKIINYSTIDDAMGLYDDDEM